LEKPQYGNFSTRHIVANVPETKSFVRVIQIPRMSDADAENAIPFEAENFIPLPIDQVYLDWQKLGEAEDKMNILIIASPKEYIDSYLGIFDKAGLTSMALEVESQSCARSFIAEESKDNVLIVDISASRTNLIMVENGHLQFSSTIPIAGNNFTESIAKGLGISNLKAEVVKVKVGIANTAEYPNIKILLLPVLNNLIAEIKNILQFQSQHSSNKVSKILLAGGGAKLSNIAEFMAPEFAVNPGAEIELANPWIHFKNLQNPPLSPYESLEFGTVIGLARRGIML
jgi:type IV pilus assembly protein PilM